MAVTKLPQGTFGSKVDGREYEFEKWGAEDALDTLLDLTTVAGKPIGMMATTILGKNADGTQKTGMTEITPDIAKMIMGELTANLGTHKRMVMDLLIKLTSQKVLCEGRGITFKTHYADNLPHMFRVAYAALEVQYGNFFDAVRDAGVLQAR